MTYAEWWATDPYYFRDKPTHGLPNFNDPTTTIIQAAQDSGFLHWWVQSGMWWALLIVAVVLLYTFIKD